MSETVSRIDSKLLVPTSRFPFGRRIASGFSQATAAPLSIGYRRWRAGRAVHGTSAYRAAMRGRRVVFNVASSGGVELWTKPIEGGAESALVGMQRLKYSDSWAVVARGIYFTESRTSAPVVLRFYDFASQRISDVRGLQGMPEPLGGLGMSVSRDERWILYTRTGDWQGDIMMVSGREELGGGDGDWCAIRIEGLI